MEPWSDQPMYLKVQQQRLELSLERESRGVINTSNEIVNQTAKIVDSGLPRVEQPNANPASIIRNGEQIPVRVNDGTIPTDKSGRALEPGLGTERGAVKIVDTAAPGASSSFGQYCKKRRSCSCRR